MNIEARVLAGNHVAILKEEEVLVVPAGDVVIAVSGSGDLPILLDGRRRPFQDAGGSRIFSLDLTRSTGFHHLHVAPGRHFFFGTEDAKAGLEGVREMLAFLRTECKAWSGQLLFSDGSVLRDTEVVYGWLDQHAEAALTCAERVAESPRKKRRTQSVITSRGGKKPRLAATLKLLRAEGHELLEESSDGPLFVGTKRFVPRKVAATRTTTTIDTRANRRVTHLLLRLMELADEVATETTDESIKERASSWRIRANRALMLSSLATLVKVSQRPEAPHPMDEEQLVPEYMETYRIGTLLNNEFAWTGVLQRQPQHSYIAYSDEIYQAFVIYSVAEALGMTAQASMLGAAQPAFVGSGWALYSNVVPPASIMRSWRSYTSRPDYYRPDVLFFNESRQCVVMADAKFRNDGEEASESSRKELLSYMAAYGTGSAVIFYPPVPNDRLTVRTIEWKDQRLTEVSVAPTPNLQTFLQNELESVLEAASFQPQWTD
jgi:hypothetical protein